MALMPSHDDEHDAPTPRQSAMWQLFGDRAREVASRLLVREIRLGKPESLDTTRQRLIRHVRGIMESYALMFDRWNLEEMRMKIDQKERERSEFAAFETAALLLLSHEPDSRVKA